MTVLCPTCRQPVTPQAKRSGPPKVYCSRSCSRAAVQSRRRLRPGRKDVVNAQSSSRARQAHRARARVVTCPICSARFCPLFGRQSHVTSCSPSCSAERERRMRCRKELTRKARKRKGSAEAIDPHEVGDAYGWRCASCRRATPARLRGSTSLNAPEIDHVVPLADDGEHVRSNVQLLCRACNRAKSSTRTHLL